ncbi:MAG TPA: hypothetical protein VF868_11830 [Bacteroidia bacterium]|jgi:hypothetical protein
MKNTYALIQDYFFNSAYSFTLFGLYAVTVAPFINNFIEFGEPNAFVGLFGLAVLIAEFFALKYKIKVIRVRTQLKRLEFKKRTGIDVIPTITPGVLFGLFTRLVFHVIIIMICMSSLGFDCDERKMSPAGVLAIMGGFLLEIGGITYFFIKQDIYTDIPDSKKLFREEVKEDNEWAKANLINELNKYSHKKEVTANIILQIFSCMLFSTFWQYINTNGIETLITLHRLNSGAIGTFILLFPVMVATIIVGLRPMQIAYWIESSLLAFSSHEKKKNWIIYLTVGVFACAPTIIKYFEIFILRIPGSATAEFPEYLEYLITFALFVSVLWIELRMLKSKEPETVPTLLNQQSVENMIAEIIDGQNRNIGTQKVKLIPHRRKMLHKKA